MAEQIAEHDQVVEGQPMPQMQDAEARADVKMVKDLFDQGKRARAKYDANWKTYREFYEGKQWSPTRSKFKAKPVLNICRVTIQSTLPILTDARPGFNVMPGEPQDFKFAKMLGEVTQSWWEKPAVSMDHTLVQVLMDSQIYPAGVLKVFWDPDMEEGAGEIKCEVVSPEDIFIPDDAKDFHKDCPWVIQRMYKTVGELRRIYPEFAHLIKADETKEDDKSEAITTDVTLVSPIDRHSDADTKPPVSGKDERKVALILEAWMDDNSLEEYFEENKNTGKKEKKFKKKYPRGKLVTILPNQNLRLQGVENPNFHAQKPFIRFIDALVPRQFWGEGEVSPLMDIQKILNKIVANILDYMTLMSNPFWKVEKGSGVDPDDITNAIGLILQPDEGKSGAVTREMAPPLNEAIFRFYDTMQKAAEMISGSSDITQGRKPTGVSAAAAIEDLQEAAHTRIRLKERNMQVSLTQLGTQVIQLMMQYYTETRVARITGKNEWPDFFEFFIEETPEGKKFYRQKFAFNEQDEEFVREGAFEESQPSKGIFDVQVLSGTAMPWAKSKRVATAFRLFENQALTTEGLLEALEWPDKDQELRRLKEQAQNAAEAEAALGGASPAGGGA